MSIASMLSGVVLDGKVNTEDEVILANVRSSIRRGHPQIKQLHGVQPDPVALVCGGPSLESTLPELRQLIATGHKVVTVNGAYAWCIERNIIPSMQVVMDARASNARFVDPPLPRCHYAFASQCDPKLWDAVEGRPNVWIYHVCVSDEESKVREEVEQYYRGNWQGISGGTTVGTRAIALCRVLGYIRMQVFGMDSCWMDGQHHAYDQPENSKDRCLTFVGHPEGHPELSRTFKCSPWHVKQVDDFMQFVHHNGHHFMLQMHGDGLLAYIMNANAQIQLTDQGE